MDEEIKITNDMDVEIVDEQKNSVQPTRLEKEIKLEEESRKLNKDNIENFKKSQKPKKSLKKKIIAWALGAGIFAGAVAGGVVAYKGANSDQNKYINEVKSRYEMVDETLTEQVNRNTKYGILTSNKQINAIRFNDPTDDSVQLEVYYEGDAYNIASQRWRNFYGSATFKVLINYYNALVEAEQSSNVLLYLDALNEVFKNMQYENSEIHDKIDFLTDFSRSEENFIKINELFKLDFQHDEIIRQIGFLPYNISLVQESKDASDPDHAYKYTYKLSGISYCEVKSESSETIKQSDHIVITSGYNKNHVKAFYRDITISADEPLQYGRPNYATRLSGDINMLFVDSKTRRAKTIDDFDVQTTYFQETNIFEEFLNMKETGNFNYEIPSNFNIIDYLESTK